MNSLLFLFFYFSFLIFWYYLIKYSGIKFLTISIPSFLIISIIVFQYLGYPILFYFLNDYRAKFVQDRSIMLTIFLITCYTTTLIILGFIFAKKTFGPLHLKNRYNSFSSTIFLDRQLSRFILYLFFALSILVLLIYISKIGFGNIALLSLFGENDTSIKLLRSNMGNSFDGKYHWYRLFMRDFLSITSVALFGFYLLRKKLFYLLFFTISFFISCFSMIIATEKAPIIWYLVSLFLIYILIKKNGRIDIKNIIWLGFFVFLLLGFIYVNFMGSSDIPEGMKNAIFRITTGQIQPLYHYLEIFPKHIDFFWGRSFPNPGGLMPYESASVPKKVFAFVFPEKIESGIVGSMPTFFWGDMYANFGYAGIIFPPFFIGFLLYGLNILLFRFPMTPIFLSVYIWIILHYKSLAVTSLGKFIIDIKMFIVIFFLILVLSTPNYLKIKYLKFKKSSKM
jgi:oligosaccharide repeat unit polymerase